MTPLSPLSPLAKLSLLLLVTLQTAHSYKTGAPTQACRDMYPQHGYNAQTSAPPYTIAPNDTRINGGDRIAVELKATLNYFKGFFIQARQSLKGDPVGTFFSRDHKTVDCPRGLDNAITHKEEKHMDSITVEWEPPSDFEGEVAFVTTVVKGYKTFWTELCSEKVSVKRRRNNGFSLSGGLVEETRIQENTKDEATRLNAKTYPDNAGMDKLYEGCDVSKTCFGYPRGCSAKKSCDYVVALSDAGNGQKEFELKGRGGSNRYVAVGLSQDQTMGDDSVVVCSSQDGDTDVYMAWNEGKSNQNIVNASERLTVLNKTESDGILYCKFLREDVTQIKNVEFDLKNGRYYIMVAEGPLSAGKTLMYHSENRMVSNTPFPDAETKKRPTKETEEDTWIALGWLSSVIKKRT